jgi:hypothetical protein
MMLPLQQEQVANFGLLMHVSSVRSNPKFNCNVQRLTFYTKLYLTLHDQLYTFRRNERPSQSYEKNAKLPNEPVLSLFMLPPPRYPNHIVMDRLLKVLSRPSADSFAGGNVHMGACTLSIWTDKHFPGWILCQKRFFSRGKLRKLGVILRPSRCVPRLH